MCPQIIGWSTHPRLLFAFRKKNDSFFFINFTMPFGCQSTGSIVWTPYKQCVLHTRWARTSCRSGSLSPCAVIGANALLRVSLDLNDSTRAMIACHVPLLRLPDASIHVIISPLKTIISLFYVRRAYYPAYCWAWCPFGQPATFHLMIPAICLWLLWVLLTE